MLPPPRHVLFLILAIVLVGLSYVGGLLNGTGQESNPAPRDASRLMIERSPGRSTRGSGLTVDVAGEVHKPGVYVLPSGSRVLDALTRAGGPTPQAASDQINRAAPVVDGQHIVILAAAPASPSVAPSAPSTSVSASAEGRPISINAGTPDELEKLPGIGPATAQAIVEDRAANGPFGAVSELDRVAGIGPATIADLESAVTL